MNYRLFIEIVAQIGSRIVCSLLGLVLVTQLCRYLSIEDFGLYTLSFSVLAFFSPVVDVGLNTIAIREIIRTPERGEVILSSVVFVKLLMTIVSLIAAVLFAVWIGTDTHQQSVIVLTSLGLLNLVLNSFDVWLVVRHRMIMWGAAQVLASLFGLLTILLLIWREHSLHTIVLAQIGTISLAYGWVFSRIRGEFSFCRPQLEVVRFMVRESLPQGIASLLAAYYFNIDMIMLAKMVNTEGVAFYGAAYRLLNLMVFVPHAIMMSFMPMLTRALKQGRGEFAWFFRYVFQLMLFLALPIALWASWFADDIIALIYTSNYAAAAPVLVLLMWAGVGVFASHLSGYTLVILNRQHVGMYISGAALGLNIVLNLWLIQVWGILGAAVATLMTETLVVVTGYLLCFRYIRIMPFNALLLRCVTLTSVAAIILAVLGENAFICTLLIWGLVGLSFLYFLRGKDASQLHEYLR